MSKAKIITFGCRLNIYESEVMGGYAEQAGLGEAVIINSCAVTGEAVRRARQAVRKARRENPDIKIIVTGCAAQIDPQMFADMAQVDAVIGNDEKMKPQTFASLARGESERLRVNDIMSVKQTANHMISGFGRRARAYVQIQNGCDHRCTFCIIPFGRGNSRSVPAGDVVAQIRTLCQKGYQEIVLTGVDITAYGHDIPGHFTLGKLCMAILKHVPELNRLRISSIDSVEADDALLDVIAHEKRFMPHLHLSLQSGDNMILKRMKRRHQREHSIAFCHEIKQCRPDMIFGADLIAGFPTETEQMFQNTLDLIDECGLTFLHIFPYSPRPGTPAALMPQVEKKIIKQRARRLREKGNEVLATYLENCDGKIVSLLMEGDKIGRTEQFTEVYIDGPYQPGAMIMARITGQIDRRLKGEILYDGA